MQRIEAYQAWLKWFKDRHAVKAVSGLIILITFSGCVSQRQCTKRFPCTGQTDTVIRSETVFIPHDTVIKIPADSSFIQALIDCRGQTAKLMQTVQYGTGKRANLPIVRIYHDTLFVECKFDSSGIAFRYYDTHKSEFLKTSKTVIVKENYLTGWQWFQIWAGRVLFGIVLIWIVVTLIRRYTGIKL